MEAAEPDPKTGSRNQRLESQTPADGSFPCPEPCSFLLEATRNLADVAPADPTTPVDPSAPDAAFDRPGNRTQVRDRGAQRELEAATSEPTTDP